MGTEDIFRYNFDLWRDYKFEVNEDGFRIEDPVGRVAHNDNVGKFLWRKPARTKDIFSELLVGEEERYVEEELWYALREVVNLLWAQGKVVLIEPFADLRVGKFMQLKVAQRYFNVAKYQFRLAFPTRFKKGTDVVVKSLTLEPVSTGTAGKESVIICTTKVPDDQLSPSHPWMVQEHINADFDVTVVFVRDRLFAFEFDRRALGDKIVDWRELPVETTSNQWRPHTLPQEVERKIFQFMSELMLHFGRLDFLYANNLYYFLEVNPNGQWAWLDAEGKHGLLSKITEEISPLTPLNSIPVRRSLPL